MSNPVEQESKIIPSNDSEKALGSGGKLELESSEDPSEVLDRCFQQIGFGRYQWAMWVLCGLGWVSDNMWTSAPSIVLSQVQTEFKVSSTISGLGSSALSIGQFFGAFLWGSLADQIGRKPVFLITLAITTLFGIAITFSPTFWVFCLFFAALGVGVGGNLPVDGTIFLECVPSDKRYMLTLMTFWWPLGNILDAVFGWAALPGHSCAPLDPNCHWQENKGWRYTIFAFGCVTGVILFGRLVLFRMLESPKYYIANGKTDKAVAILQEMANRNGRDLPDITTSELLAVDGTLGGGDGPAKQEARKGVLSHSKSALHSLSPLFATPKESVTTVLVILIWTIANLAGTTFYIFLPVFIANHGHLSVNQTYRNYLIQALCALPGTIASHFACNSFLGRRWTMSLTAFGTGAFILLFTTSTQPGAQLAFNCISSFLANLLWGGIYTYTPEVFPVAIRGRGTGLASATSRIIGAFAPFIGGRLIGIELKFPLYLSVGLYGLLALCAAALPLETRMQARDLIGKK